MNVLNVLIQNILELADDLSFEGMYFWFKCNKKIKCILNDKWWYIFNKFWDDPIEFGWICIRLMDSLYGSHGCTCPKEH